MSDEEIYPGFPAPAGFGTIPVEDIPQSTGLELLQGIVTGRYPAPPIGRVYLRARRWIQGGLGLFFCFASWKLATARL